MNITNTILIIVAIFAFSVCIAIILSTKKEKKPVRPHHHLKRHTNNPVISPIPFKEWEVCGTFNPAAFTDDENIVHLLYRAIGGDGISRIGYASSGNGRDFQYRSMYPIYEPLPGYGMPDAAKITDPKEYNPSFYTSGGGWGGSEDPRTVRIGNKVYMTYVAFEGWHSVRMALTSIKLDDFKQGKWRWKRPRMISAPGTIAKNWVIFPEKINGKYAILHGITPDVLVDYVDNLDTFGDNAFISSKPPRGGRKGFWDNWVRGAGPPPLKTSLGWLLLYHAMDKDDPNKYKLGAMILDKDDPSKVLYRSPQPILSPDMHYENDGKPGVIYATGAVIIGDKLVVYYGGGDKHVCVAETELDPLLTWLMNHGKIA